MIHLSWEILHYVPLKLCYEAVPACVGEQVSLAFKLAVLNCSGLQDDADHDQRRFVLLVWKKIQIRLFYISTGDDCRVVSGTWLGGAGDLRRVYLATSDIGHPICLAYYCLWRGESGGFIGCCWTDSCCVWLLTRGLITSAWEGHYLWASCRPASHDAAPDNNRSGCWTEALIMIWARVKSFELGVFATSGHIPRLRRNTYICLCFASEGTLMAAALQSFWQMRLCYYFSFQTLPLSLSLSVCLSAAGCVKRSTYWFLSLSVSHFSSLHMSWSQQLHPPPPPPPPPPSAASCERDSCENSVESVQPGGGKKPGALLLHLPILTRFSRDIRGNKRLRSKAPPDNFWTASPLHLKCGDTDSKPVHEFAFVVAVFSIRNKRKTF